MNMRVEHDTPKDQGAQERNPKLLAAVAAAGIVVVVLVAVAVWLWLDDGEDAAPVSVAGISNENAFDGDGFADSLVGRTVQVDASVTEVLTPNAIRIGGDDVADLVGDDGLLVLTPAAGTLEDGQAVRIDGIVRAFDPSSLEGDFGWDLRGLDVQPWEGENILSARQVTEQ